MCVCVVRVCARVRGYKVTPHVVPQELSVRVLVLEPVRGGCVVWVRVCVLVGGCLGASVCVRACESVGG